VDRHHEPENTPLRMRLCKSSVSIWCSTARAICISPTKGQSGLHDPTGRLYRLRPSGHLDLLLANVPSPNGVCLSPDESVLKRR